MMFIQPTWPASQKIKAFTTLRIGGVSLPPYHGFNLAEHVGDTLEHVQENRSILKKELDLKNEPIWINQTHSSIAIEAMSANTNQEADASYTTTPNQVCVILTADCLPILICNKQETEVAAVHAGWRGLASGIITSTLSQLKSPRSDLIAWLGPAISATNYEVGSEVRDAFLRAHPDANFAFLPSLQQRWLADLYALARLILIKEGVSPIYGGDFCTFADASRFYSYRRDGRSTGRMASLIWISAGDS